MLQTGKKIKPFLDLLFELNDACGEEIFSDEVIREHVDTFIAAGNDTVALTLVYTMLLIGSYPDIQAKIYNELQEVIGKSDRDVVKEDLSQLVYLEVVLKESMRLYPVGPVIARIIDKDIKLKNYMLYAGTTCVFMITGIHTNAMWGADAEQFRPERWLDHSSLPKNPNSFAAFSHGKRVCIDLWNLVKKISYTCLDAGGVISAYIGPRTYYVITDPEDCLTVVNSCLQKDAFYDFAKPWLGDGLVTGTLSKWKHHRKLLTPAFSQIAVVGFQGIFNNQSRRIVKNLEVEVGKGPFDHWAYTRRNALETICLTALGMDFRDNNSHNSEYERAVEQMLNILVERFQKFWLRNDFIWSWSRLKKKQDHCLKILHNTSETIIKYRKAAYINKKKNGLETSTGTKFKAFLDLILELAVEEGAFNDLEIREHVDTFIVSGYDTSANVLMFTLLLVGSYPKVQQKIFNELHGIFGNEDRDITKNDLSQMVYLEAVIKETLRIYPIAPLTARKLDRNVKLKNYVLTEGRTCFMYIYGIHRHPMWGKDVEEFKPERWLDPTPACSTAFAAFNIGRRSCIGKSYAYMSMKTTLGHIFRHYTVKGDHTQMKLKCDIMLKPVSGHQISIERRALL